ncbi:MAG: TIGR03557 family F420-dependent LLM class oxidoreductase [Actinomycetota bacterium]|nr:TIGR03557 family F420-dependent LLM class oxidoreductase [Actinomycetota bacterium]
MTETRYWMSVSHEQFPPADLLRQAVEVEQAGFDALGCSDHFQPWWEGGESGHAWVWLGGAGCATERVGLGPVVSVAAQRYHPALVAQAISTLEAMFPGRAFLGLGSGESLNESPLGMDWPSPKVQIEMMEEALEIIHGLFDGARLSHAGRHFQTKRAYLHTRPERRPPVYVSAFGPQAAGVAGRWGDGLWTLADSEQAPQVIDAYRAAADDAGRLPGEILLHTGVAWAADEEALWEGSKMWKGAQPPEFFTDDWHDPERMQAHAEREISDEALRSSFIISTDPGEHIDRIRDIERLGASVVSLQNVSGADPHGTIRTYGERVLPALREAAG